MGADMLIAALVLPVGRRPDFAAAHRDVDTVAAADVAVRGEFHDLDLDTEQGLQALRADLHRRLDELEQALDGREFNWITVRGANVYVTGGLSWGDSPTQAFKVVNRLRAVGGVLATAGFEGEPR